MNVDDLPIPKLAAAETERESAIEAPIGGMGEDWSTLLTASWQQNRMVAIIKPCLTRRPLPRTGMRSVSNSKRPWVLYAIGKC
jgi:hypothetical protein